MPDGLSRALALVFTAWFGLLLATAVCAAIPLARVPVPDVAALVLLFAGLSLGASVASVCLVAGAIGYLADLTTGAPKGIHLLVAPLAALALRSLSRRLLVRRSGLFQMLVAAGFTALFELAVIALHVVVDPEAGWGALARLPSQVVATALVASPVLALLSRVDAALTRGSVRPGKMGAAA